jgi:SAM-dependent methyltransferase
VLDAACGEGYGSALLAADATQVVGVDVSAAAIAHARSRYGSVPNLRFERADVVHLGHPAGHFDLVVSFETLEHLAEQTELIAGFARVLADDGMLVISTPDRRTYSDESGFRNEFHVRELYRDEFLGLLKAHFPVLRLYGQKLLFQSVLWSDESGGVEAWTAPADGGGADPGLGYAPMYYVAICSRTAIPELPAISLFGDRGESVYSHYNHEIRKNMRAGERIAELEAEIERLRRQIAGP